MKDFKRNGAAGQPASPENSKPAAGAFQQLFRRIKDRSQDLKQRRAFLPGTAQTDLSALKPCDAAVEPIMSQMTDELIAETVGPDGVIIQEFRRQIAGYNPDVNPISPQEAAAILQSLLDLAVSRRKLLNERLEKSIESGALYDSYYSRVQLINQLATKAHSAMERMDFAEEDYRYYYELLLNIRARSIAEDVAPDGMTAEKLEAIRDRMSRRGKDVMLELDQMGGG